MSTPPLTTPAPTPPAANAPVETITGYHAHVYYDASNRAIAERCREALGRQFEVVLGRWHDPPVGPHPRSMYQVAFGVREFPRLVPWLMLNRAGLTVLVHPDTGDPLADHRDHALWLGEKLALNFKALEPRAPSAHTTSNQGESS